MTTQVATLGGGCFWCQEAVFLELRGVMRVGSGYSGGHVANPGYAAVCTGDTGHAEVVQVPFDPAEIGYDDVLRAFFASHDPTTLNRQGNDVGTQYRSVIFTHDAAQDATARAIIAELGQAGLWPGRIVTEVVAFTAFWPAGPEHADYFAKNPWSGYCRAVIAPKLAHFRASFADRLRRRGAD